MFRSEAECLTFRHLRSLGFDDCSSASGAPSLRYDFGSFSLDAVLMLNRYFREVVALSGIRTTSRTLSEISHEMHPDIETCAEVGAHIAWALRYELASMANPPEWVLNGHQNSHLLPWEQERAAYEARPRCTVEREWLKLALKKLSDTLRSGDSNPDQQVFWGFDGEALRIRTEHESILIPATGAPWQGSFTVSAGHMGQLPTRLMQSEIEISVWQGRLSLGNRVYPTARVNSPP